MRPLVVVGDALLDRDVEGTVERVCPDAPVPVVDTGDVRSRPGGAGLAAVLLAVSQHRPVVLLTAIGRDATGAELRRLLGDACVEICDLGLRGPTPGKVRVRAGGQSLLRLDHGGPPTEPGPPPARAGVLLTAAAAVLVADYGRGVAAHASIRAALGTLPARTPTVWDPHPRGSDPTDGVRLVTPNAAEAAQLVPDAAGRHPSTIATRATVLRERWRAGGVAVTLGPDGALLAALDGPPLAVPAPVVASGDPCGAGDRFAGAALAALAEGAVLSEAVVTAVRAASAYVAAGGVDAALGRPHGPGRLVAAGGCFDLLHAGHVAMLQAARRLGDRLVVCLNSDASVRRLKGPDRPLQPHADRAAVLLALDCVDAVEVFDEDTPAALLERLRPQVFCKGGDYAASDLPEAQVLAQWGGQAVVLPYLPGRSTTRLLEAAGRRGS